MNAVRPLQLQPIVSASIVGQFVAIDAGYAFQDLLTTEATFGEWWGPRGEPATDGPVVFSPIWLHPGGYRSVFVEFLWTTDIDSRLWLLDVDSSFRGRRATLLASIPRDVGLRDIVAPRNATRGRFDLCLVSRDGGSELASIDDHTLIHRTLPVGTRCVDAIDSSDGTLFLVGVGDGGQRVLRVGASEADWIAGEMAKNCRLALGADQMPTTWCVDGRRLWMSPVADRSTVEFELQGESEWELVGVLGTEQTVVVRQPQLSRYWLVGANGRTWSAESRGDRAFYGRLDYDTVAFGSRLHDGGVELNLVCW